MKRDDDEGTIYRREGKHGDRGGRDEKEGKEGSAHYNKSKHSDATDSFRRAFLNNDCSLASHQSARAFGFLGGDFTYAGQFTYLPGDILVPHGAMGTQKGEFGHVAYMGAWDMGMRHGKGCSYRPNGSIEFDGEWHRDGYSTGKYYLSSGRLEYEGAFDAANNLPHGSGTFHFADGSRHEGKFFHGHFHGPGTVFSASGELVVKGRYEMGRIVEGCTALEIEAPLDASSRSSSSVDSTSSSGSAPSSALDSHSLNRPLSSSEASTNIATSSEDSPNMSDDLSEKSAFDGTPASPLPEGVEIPPLELATAGAEGAASKLLQFAGNLLSGSSSDDQIDTSSSQSSAASSFGDSDVSKIDQEGGPSEEQGNVDEANGSATLALLAVAMGSSSSASGGVADENATLATIASVIEEMVCQLESESQTDTTKAIENTLEYIISEVVSSFVPSSPQLQAARIVVESAVGEAIQSVSPSKGRHDSSDESKDSDLDVDETISGQDLSSELSLERSDNDELDEGAVAVGVEEAHYMGIIARAIMRYRSRRTLNSLKERLKIEHINTEYSDPWTSRARGRGAAMFNNPRHNSYWSMVAYAGKYNANSGEPEGEQCTCMLEPVSPDVRSSGARREYRGNMTNGHWHGWGTLSLSSRSLNINNSSSARRHNGTMETGKSGSEAESNLDSGNSKTKLDIKGFWEMADIANSIKQCCYGKMPCGRNVKHGDVYHGRIIDAKPCGHGSIKVLARNVESKAQEVRGSRFVAKKVARFWFGRTSGCMKDQTGARTASESQGARKNWRKTLRLEDLNSESSLELVRMAGIDEFSGTISDSGETFVPLRGLAVAKTSMFYKGKTFRGKSPCGMGKIVANRGARLMNPLAHVFEGFWEGGIQRHGTTQWENGDMFVGDHDAHGRPHGSGRMDFGGCLHAGEAVCPRFCTGPKCYFGDWSKGMLHGVGELAFRDGRVYRGRLINNTLCGLGTMYYTDGRKVTGEWLHAKPLHPSTHVAVNVVIEDVLKTTKVSCAIHGFAHGVGTRKWHEKGKQDQVGEFHWGVYIKPLDVWIAELVVSFVDSDVFDAINKSTAKPASPDIGKDSEDSDASTGIEDEEDGSSNLLNFAKTQASANGASALQSFAAEQDNSVKESGQGMEDSEHAEIRREATSELLSAANAISEDVCQATSELLSVARNMPADTYLNADDVDEEIPEEHRVGQEQESELLSVVRDISGDTHSNSEEVDEDAIE